MPDMERVSAGAYRGMGFSESETEMIVKANHRRPQIWLRFMMHEDSVWWKKV